MTDECCYSHLITIQTRICNQSELDCVAKVRVGESSCREQCEGTSLQVERLFNSPRNQEGIELFYEDYESYKNPLSDNLTYPRSIKGGFERFPMINPLIN